MRVSRIDIGSLGAAEILPNGWLKAPGRFTKTGVFTYRNLDGSLRRELRHPEDVFHPDAMRSFEMVPVTLHHPPVMLDSTNTKQYGRGHTGERLVQDGSHLAGPILVTDEEAIAAVKGGAQELSCGYSCVLEMESGVYEGEPYDCRQKEIRGNHLAIVGRGRAGPTARLMLDHFDAVQVDTSERNDTAMKKILINGVWYEVSETIAQAYEQEQNNQKSRLDAKEQELKATQSELEKTKARADSLSEDLSKEKKARQDAEDPTKVQAKVKARVELETVAKKHLGAEAKFDGLSDKEIKAKVVQKKYPNADKEKLKNDDYLQARFDTAIEQSSPDESRTDTATSQNDFGREIITRTDDAAPTADDPEAVRRKTIKEENERWKQPLNK